MNKPFVLYSTVTECGAGQALVSQALLLNHCTSVGSRSLAIGLFLGIHPGCSLITKDYSLVPTPLRKRGLLADPIFLTFGGPTEIRVD